MGLTVCEFAAQQNVEIAVKAFDHLQRKFSQEDIIFASKLRVLTENRKMTDAKDLIDAEPSWDSVSRETMNSIMALLWHVAVKLFEVENSSVQNKCKNTRCFHPNIQTE